MVKNFLKKYSGQCKIYDLMLVSLVKDRERRLVKSRKAKYLSCYFAKTKKALNWWHLNTASCYAA